MGGQYFLNAVFQCLLVPMAGPLPSALRDVYVPINIKSFAGDLSIYLFICLPSLETRDWRAVLREAQ